MFIQWIILETNLATLLVPFLILIFATISAAVENRYGRMRHQNGKVLRTLPPWPPKYMGLQCLSIYLVCAYMVVGTLVDKISVTKRSPYPQKEKEIENILSTVLYYCIYNDYTEQSSHALSGPKMEWTSDPFVGVLSPRFYRAFSYSIISVKGGAAILLETHLSAERRSGSRCRWLNRRRYNHWFFSALYV